MKEADNVLRILRDTKTAIERGDLATVKQLSNQTIHTATISQDADNVIIAVLVYSLSKILEREHYKEMEGWKEFYSSFVKNWDLAIKSLENNNLDKFRTSIGAIRNSINKVSGNLSEYIKDIFYKAEINKAFKLYEHGLSSEQTAELLGVSLWDLSSYIGQSTISEAHASETIPIEKRIKFAEEIFS